MYKKKSVTKIIAIFLLICSALFCSACGSSIFTNDAEMQVTVRGAYASMDNINNNGGYFLIVEDDNVCEISFLNGLLGQDSEPLYTAMTLDHPIEKRDYKNGKIITKTDTYTCKEINNLSTDKYDYTKIKEAGNILLTNAEHFIATNINVKDYVFSTKLYSGNFTSDISSKAVLLKFYFYDESYDTIQSTKYFYCYQVNKDSNTTFEVSIGNDINTNNCVLMAYYI